MKALAFLNGKYKLLSIFVIIVSILLFIVLQLYHQLIDDCNALYLKCFSSICGNIGMKIATRTNVRTTSRKNILPEALKISFGGGTVMGLGVFCLAKLGLRFFYFFITTFSGEENLC